MGAGYLGGLMPFRIGKHEYTRYPFNVLPWAKRDTPTKNEIIPGQPSSILRKCPPLSEYVKLYKLLIKSIKLIVNMMAPAIVNAFFLGNTIPLGG